MVIWCQREREMFYLMTHSTHSIYGYMVPERERERNVLFNDTLITFYLWLYGARERERNVLFNDTLITFYLWLYGAREREMFYLMTHSTHFIYGYMVSDIWLRTILIVRKETHCRHIGYSYRLTARVLLYAPSHRQDNTYHGLCYTSHGALAGTRNSSMGPPHEGSIRRPTAPWANALPLSYVLFFNKDKWKSQR